MSRPKSDARERLLAATMEYMWQHGVGDLSLRQLATAIGTSHRMLIYHFGSKEGLLVEVARAVERQEQAIVAEMATADDSLTPVEELRRIWTYASGPQLFPYVRLFFELYGQALQGRSHTTDFLDGNVENWLEPLSKVFRRGGRPARRARDDARLALATMRGLLLDLVATNDRAAVNRAMERFLDSYDALLEQTPSKPVRRAS